MNIYESNNCCVMCGEIIPEGRQVCQLCTDKANNATYKKPKRKFSLCYLISKVKRKENQI